MRSSTKNVSETTVEELVPAKKNKNVQFLQKKINPGHPQGGEKKRLLDRMSMEGSSADRTYEKGERKEDHAPLVF